MDVSSQGIACVNSPAWLNTGHRDPGWHAKAMEVSLRKPCQRRILSFIIKSTVQLTKRLKDLEADEMAG